MNNQKMTVGQILTLLDSLAPFALAEEWDHCGLRLGNSKTTVSSVAFSLNPSAAAVHLAAHSGCQLLITHHPLLFHPADNLICDRIDIKTAQAAFSSGIDIISCHTNFDCCIDGVNQTLARQANIQYPEPLISHARAHEFGMGAMGTVSEQNVIQFCDQVAKAWHLTGYRYYGCETIVSNVALCGGAGADLWRAARVKGAHLYITADMSYHECLEAVDSGLNLMICDHGEMEELPLKFFSEQFKRASGLPVTFISNDSVSHVMAHWRSMKDHV